MSEIKREQLLMAIIAGRGPAYLRGVDLSFMDLSNAAWLSGADLSNANLANATLRRSDLRGANMERANLHSANLLSTNLEGASLLYVKANVANFTAAKLRGVNMRGITLVGATLMRADLEEADLEGADLEGANLEGCNLRRARLTNVKFKMANFEGADLTDAVVDANMANRRELSTEEGFRGTISSISLTDLLQLGCLSRSRMEIEVKSNGERGNIYIGQGRVLHALTGEINGEAALLRMLGWENGRFTSRPSPSDCTATIDKPIEHLLLQAVRLRDEDRYLEKNLKLMQKIRNYVPLKSDVSSELVEFLQADGKKLDISEKIEILDVFDSEDGEEILCSVSARDDMFIAPLKYVSLNHDHPLFSEIARLQSG